MGYRNLKIKKVYISMILACAFVSSNSQATVVLDFEGISNKAHVNDFYNGGTDSAGNHGSNYGISFSPDALVVIDRDAGGTGNFANEPSASTALFFLSGSAVLNDISGFDTGFSFFYSSLGSSRVDVYEGLNKTGNILASLNLSANYNYNCNGDPTGAFCHWDAVGVSFSGIAHSIDFGGTANKVGFDDVTFGSSIPGRIPEPTSLALLGLGLTGFSFLRKKKVI